jgi:hypothetical protein
MPLGPLGATALLVALDWGAWNWATNSDQSVVGLIAGLLMAPIAVAFTWSLVRVLIALARLGLQRVGPESAGRGESVLRSSGASAPFDIETQDERLAA